MPGSDAINLLTNISGFRNISLRIEFYISISSTNSTQFCLKKQVNTQTMTTHIKEDNIPVPLHADPALLT